MRLHSTDSCQGQRSNSGEPGLSKGDCKGGQGQALTLCSCTLGWFTHYKIVPTMVWCGIKWGGIRSFDCAGLLALRSTVNNLKIRPFFVPLALIRVLLIINFLFFKKKKQKIFSKAHFQVNQESFITCNLHLFSSKHANWGWVEGILGYLLYQDTLSFNTFAYTQYEGIQP